MRLVLPLLLLISVAASGQVINTNDWQVRGTYPTKIGGLHNPSLEQLRDAGWREYVPCPGVEGSNIVATSYSDDGDTVTASCEYDAAPIPDAWDIEPNTLVPIMDGTNLIGTARLVAGPDLALVAVTNSASPERPKSVQLADIETEQSRAQAIRDELNLTPQQVDLIRQWVAADTDTLFSNLNANQRRFLKIQHQLVRMLAKRELKEIGD